MLVVRVPGPLLIFDLFGKTYLCQLPLSWGTASSQARFDDPLLVQTPDSESL